MAVVVIQIPQLGEGLQEARLVQFLKHPGDTVSRDEPIYVMETDKAATEVESPHAGKLKEWLVEEESILPIGAKIGILEVAEEVAEVGAEQIESPSAQGADSSTSVGPLGESLQATAPTSLQAARAGAAIPPRTKRYLKEKGLLEIAHQIPAAGTKLTQEDVDRFLAQGPRTTDPLKTLASEAFDETPVPAAQQALIYRIARGAQVTVPAVLETELDWTHIAASREQTRLVDGPTGFAMFLWCVGRAMRAHPVLRSTLSSDGKTLRTYRHVNLGVAVSLPGDGLNTAVVEHADSLNQADFFEALKQRIELARTGTDQADAATTLTVSNIGAVGMRAGIPVVVTPAVATIALGQVQEKPVPTAEGWAFFKAASITMTFDHRLLNGIGAASFLNDVRSFVAHYILDTNVPKR